jgi:hypothetical protein
MERHPGSTSTENHSKNLQNLTGYSFDRCDSVCALEVFMATSRVPLNELAVAVQNAVEQALAKHGAVPIDKLWVGFVAPDKIATAESAAAVAGLLGKEGNVHAQPSVAEIGAAAAGEAKALVPPHRIIGLIFEPKNLK